MKKVYITGTNGYIASSLEKYLNKNDCFAQCISVRNPDNIDFCCDVLIHCAAIVHKKEKNHTIDDYMKINCDLTESIAKKAKAIGVKQFIFFSTMSVYGIETGKITSSTPEKPLSFYGKSKLSAEKKLLPLSSDNFKIAIIRPPMVYGKACTGNYARLSSLAKKTFIFPSVRNKRSMIYIENLCEFVKLCIEHNSEGIFLIQNKDYVCTTDMVKAIKKRGIYFSPLLGKIVSKIKKSVFNKVFGSLYYEKIPYFDNKYQIVDFEESILRTENSKAAPHNQ